MSGWIKSHRKIMDHWVAKTPEHFLWWMDILFEANYEEKECIIKDKVFIVKRGEVLYSLDTWAKRWKTNKSAARRFLIKLKKCNMIEYKDETVTVRVTVCKYDTYQHNQEEDETHLKQERNEFETSLKSTKESKNSSTKRKRATGGLTTAQPISFTDPENQSTAQQLDKELDWSSLLKIYQPEYDKGLANKHSLQNAKNKFLSYDSDQRKKIIEWFGKYKELLQKDRKWLTGFLKEHDTMDKIADEFRRVRNQYGYKEPKPKVQYVEVSTDEYAKQKVKQHEEWLRSNTH